MNEYTRKKSADGIRVHSPGRRTAGKTAVKKQPDKILPADEKKEELVIHSYSPPAAQLPSSPEGSRFSRTPQAVSEVEEISANRGAWFAFPKKTAEQTNPENDAFQVEQKEQTFSEHTLPVRSPRRFALWGSMAGLAVIIGAGALLSTVLSRATLQVKVKVEVAAIQNISIIFDASVSQPVLGQKIIPAEHLHFVQTSSQEVAVSGTKYVEERAGGMVKIFNRYNATPQKLVAQTRFLTPSGVLFRLVSPVIIPGATLEKGALVPHSVDAQLIADAPGEQANISGQVQLKIPGFKGTPKYDGFSVVASSGFSGGFRGIKKIASNADTGQAQQTATKKVYDELKEQMQQKVPPGLRLVDGLQEIRIVKVETVSTGPQKDKPVRPDQPGGLAVQATAEADTLVFHEDDVVTLLKNALLPKDGSKVLIDNSVDLTYVVHTLNFEQGRADVAVQGSVKTKQPLTQTQRNDLARALAGKKIASVREFFNSRNDTVLSDITVFPPWRSSLPSNPDRIAIVEEGGE